MDYQVSARKYRPGTFDNVIGQPHVVQTLVNAITTKRIAQAYLFSGTRGVGKTTVARILAVLGTSDLVSSDNCFFAATGITDGDLMKGVHYDARGASTQSLVMRSKSGTVRYVEGHHNFALKPAAFTG